MRRPRRAAPRPPRQILFAPLTALEVCDRRIEDQVVVVSVRPTINQSSQTIDAVIAKLQQSHVQFLDLLVDDFSHAGFPEAALAPLRALKSSAKIRQAGRPAQRFELFVHPAALLPHALVLAAAHRLACRRAGSTARPTTRRRARRR